MTFQWRSIASKKKWVLPVLETSSLAVPGSTYLSKQYLRHFYPNEILLVLHIWPYFYNSSSRWYLTQAEAFSSALLVFSCSINNWNIGIFFQREKLLWYFPPSLAPHVHHKSLVLPMSSEFLDQYTVSTVSASLWHLLISYITQIQPFH